MAQQCVDTERQVQSQTAVWTEGLFHIRWNGCSFLTESINALMPTYTQRWLGNRFGSPGRRVTETQRINLLIITCAETWQILQIIISASKLNVSLQYSYLCCLSSGGNLIASYSAKCRSMSVCLEYWVVRDGSYLGFGKAYQLVMLTFVIRKDIAALCQWFSMLFLFCKNSLKASWP